MSYKIGFCPQCDEQVMVKNSSNRWVTFKPSYRQADLLYEDGHKMRTVICESCLASPDYQKLIDSICAEDSEACDNITSQQIRERGLPVAIALAVNAPQGIKIGK